MSRANHLSEDVPLLRWSPPPKLLPFPTHRRADFVRRNAERMAGMQRDRAMQHLDCTMAALKERLYRLGLTPDMIETDIAAARVAVMTRYAALGGGGAA